MMQIGLGNKPNQKVLLKCLLCIYAKLDKVHQKTLYHEPLTAQPDFLFHKGIKTSGKKKKKTSVKTLPKK